MIVSIKISLFEFSFSYSHICKIFVIKQICHCKHSATIKARWLPKAKLLLNWMGRRLIVANWLHYTSPFPSVVQWEAQKSLLHVYYFVHDIGYGFTLVLCAIIQELGHHCFQHNQMFPYTCTPIGMVENLLRQRTFKDNKFTDINFPFDILKNVTAYLECKNSYLYLIFKKFALIAIYYRIKKDQLSCSQQKISVCIYPFYYSYKQMPLLCHHKNVYSGTKPE